tara:strand:- start:75 stop:206 length:132 start_codon:yes stop_codon:yes gene_type:complete
MAWTTIWHSLLALPQLCWEVHIVVTSEPAMYLIAAAWLPASPP